MKIENFLRETKYCDYSHPLIQATALKITKKIKGDKERAIALFNYVRDNFPYTFDYWGIKASETLKKGYGMCTNKNNLFIALLRAVNIPAGYGILRVKAREYFGPIMLDRYKSKVSEVSKHIYSYAYLNNRWVKCDPSTDKELSEKTSYFNYTTELVVWDGKNDAMDNIDPKHIINDKGPFWCIDRGLRKPFRNLSSLKIKMWNLYIRFLRTYDKRFTHRKEIERDFLRWVKKKHFFYYILFSLFS